MVMYTHAEMMLGMFFFGLFSLVALVVLGVAIMTEEVIEEEEES